MDGFERYERALRRRGPARRSSATCGCSRRSRSTPGATGPSRRRSGTSPGRPRACPRRGSSAARSSALPAYASTGDRRARRPSGPSRRSRLREQGFRALKLRIDRSAGRGRAGGRRRGSRGGRRRAWRSWSTSTRAGACPATSPPLCLTRPSSAWPTRCRAGRPLARGAARRQTTSPASPACARESGVRIAGGEMARTPAELDAYLRGGGPRRLPAGRRARGRAPPRPRAGGAGSARGRWFTPHTWTNGIGLLANLHLAAGVGGGPYLELPFDPPGWTPERRDFMLAEPLRPDADGYLAVPDRPGPRHRARRGRGRPLRGSLTCRATTSTSTSLPAPLVEALRARSEPPRLDGEVARARGGVVSGRRARDTTSSERLRLLDRDGTDVAVVSLAPTLEVGDVRGAQRRLPRGHPRARRGSADGRLRALAVRRVPGRVRRRLRFGRGARRRARPASRRARRARARCSSSTRARPAPAARSAPPWWAAVADYTAQMQAAYFAWLADGAERHPNLRVVFAVLAGGAPIQLERLRSRGGSHPRPRPQCLPRHGLLRAGARSASASRRSAPSRLVFGSDVPVIDSRTDPARPGRSGRGYVEETVRRRQPQPASSHDAGSSTAPPGLAGRDGLPQAGGRARARRLQVARRAAGPRGLPRRRRRHRRHGVDGQPRRGDRLGGRADRACAPIVYAPGGGRAGEGRA